MATVKLTGQPGTITPGGFSPDAGKVLTYGGDGTARIWSSGVVRPQRLGTAGVRHELSGRGIAGHNAVLDADPTAPVIAFEAGTNAVVAERVKTHAIFAGSLLDICIIPTWSALQC